MQMQNLLSLTRKAIDEYKMINNGDKIAIGLSGGKDSFSLLIALNEIKKFYPLNYEIIGITVSLGFDEFDTSPIKRFCDKLNIEYHVVSTNIGEIVFNDRKETNPCSLCSKLRKAALYTKAVELGCNKTALGHNKDDVIQTFFLSMFYEGRIHTFKPVTYLDRKKIYILRPLIYLPENKISSFINKQSDVNIVKNPCPVEGMTKRDDIKHFILEQSKKINDFEQKIFNQIQRLPLAGWER